MWRIGRQSVCVIFAAGLVTSFSSECWESTSPRICIDSESVQPCNTNFTASIREIGVFGCDKDTVDASMLLQLKRLVLFNVTVKWLVLPTVVSGARIVLENTFVDNSTALQFPHLNETTIRLINVSVPTAVKMRLSLEVPPRTQPSWFLRAPCWYRIRYYGCRR